VADQLQQGATDLMIAVRNAEITRGHRRLLAKRVEINRDTGQAVVQGKVVFYDGPDTTLRPAPTSSITGSGSRHPTTTLDRIREGIYEIRRAAFTTCEGDPP